MTPNIELSINSTVKIDDVEYEIFDNPIDDTFERCFYCDLNHEHDICTNIVCSSACRTDKRNIILKKVISDNKIVIDENLPFNVNDIEQSNYLLDNIEDDSLDIMGCYDGHMLCFSKKGLYHTLDVSDKKYQKYYK